MHIGPIPLGAQGRVTNSDSPIMHVLVEHDAKDTGGYFIYKWPPGTDASGPCTFDDWVETAEDLQEYFEDAAWNIEWQNAQSESKPVI
jgi:hypothetical protein